MNCNILVVGPTQSRKSTASITIARNICPERFDVKKHIAVIRADRFLEIMKNEKLYRGDVVIADDFGIGLNHRQWHSFLNKAMNQVMQTHGWKGLIVIVTVPYIKYIDSDTRLLFDFEVTTLSKSDSERYCKVKIEQLHHREIKGKMYTYKPFLRMKYPDGTIRKCKSFRIDYPPKEVMKDYFDIANPEKERLQDDLQADLKQIKRDKNRQNFNVDAHIKMVLEDPGKYVSEYAGRRFVSITNLCNGLNIGTSNAKKIKSAMEQSHRDVVANAKIQ